MTQKQKQLLLKDLCARLPYEVKGRVYAETTKGEYDMNGELIFYDSPFDVILDEINTSTEEIHVIAIGNEDTVDFTENQQIDGKRYTIDEFKPYLRSMSSMTEKEKKVFQAFLDFQAEYIADIDLDNKTDMFDWLLANHFDFRGLIEKGLALEAPEGMYEEK